MNNEKDNVYDLVEDFYAHDEVHICSSRNIHVHGKLEQLHVASDRTAE